MDWLGYNMTLPILLLASVLRAAEGDGSTPLHWASYRDELQTAARLLKAGADGNAATDLGVTPLWAACQNRSSEMVRLLLDAGSNPNIALLSGETPLMVAARSGSADIVDMLAAKGANLNARGTRGQTALMWAVSQKHASVVKALVTRGADVHLRTEAWSQMMAVPPHGYPGYNRMIPHGSYTALLFAARVGDLESARILVAGGANVNDADAWGVTALVVAAHSGFRDLAEFLLEKGADPNKAEAGFTALHEAILRRDEKLVAALLVRGADPNAAVQTWTPTRRSSKDYNFHPALVGATPFWLAARFAQPAVMRLLVKHGANPRVVHRSDTIVEKGYKHRIEETTAVMAAVGMGGGNAWVQAPAGEREALTLEAVKLAVELGAEKRTALEGAKAQGYASVVAYLSSLP